MEKVKTGTIPLKKIKHIENSRMRKNNDVSDLMEDIKRRGLLQNVGIRMSDNALIYGNRRVRAYQNLGYKEIECDFYADMDDDDLLATNVVENIKRRNIGSVELGRVCNIYREKGMTNSEIASKLDISVSRVRSSITSYTVTIGTPFEDLIVYNKAINAKGIPESFVWKVQNSLSRVRKMTKKDWNVILREAEKGNIHIEHVSQLKKVLAYDNKMSMDKAIELMKKCLIISAHVKFNENVLNKELSKQKLNTPNELINYALKQLNKDLLF